VADELRRLLTGETGREFEMLVGEAVKSLGLAEKVKIAKGVDLEALVKDDPTPFFVYVKALKVGVSKNMKRYAKKHLQAFLDALPLYGFEGHPPKPVPGLADRLDWRRDTRGLAVREGLRAAGTARVQEGNRAQPGRGQADDRFHLGRDDLAGTAERDFRRGRDKAGFHRLGRPRGRRG
jgi:hypothetical protein